MVRVKSDALIAGVVALLLCIVAVSRVLVSWTMADEPAAARQIADAGREDWFRPEAEPASLARMLGETTISTRWIYHDLDAARHEARRTGKPILCLSRCVPCGSAPGLDGAVCTAGGSEASEFEAEIRRAGGDLDALLDQFVTVRMVKMNGVNGNVFCFDRDVPYVAMFLNADGIVYGRYGTRISSDRKNLVRHNLSSFQQSMRRALRLHEAYPGNRDELATKLGPTTLPAMAEDMPTFEPFPPDHNPKVANCIHCHTVGEAEMRATLVAGTLSRRDLFPYPLPNTLGIRIDDSDGLKVESVRDGSAAANAGIRAGDMLVRLAGQPLVSEADIQWVLHEAPEQGMIVAHVQRGERIVETQIELTENWRRSDNHWRASRNPLRPHVEFRPDPNAASKGAEPGHMGLTVYYPRGPAARAGLRNGDLVVAVDGRTDMHFEEDILDYIYFRWPDLPSIELVVLRQGERLTITLPVR